MGQVSGHVRHQPDLVYQTSNLGGADQSAYLVSPGDISDLIDLERMANKHKTAIQPCFDESGRDPVGGYQPAQQHIRVEDDAHLLVTVLCPERLASGADFLID